MPSQKNIPPVAPYAGAWIEMNIAHLSTAAVPVAPYAGAWIEIMCVQGLNVDKKRRSLRGSVD